MQDLLPRCLTREAVDSALYTLDQALQVVDVGVCSLEVVVDSGCRLVKISLRCSIDHLALLWTARLHGNARLLSTISLQTLDNH